MLCYNKGNKNMQAQELIKQLQKIPPTTEIIVYTDEGGYQDADFLCFNPESYTAWLDVIGTKEQE